MKEKILLEANRLGLGTERFSVQSKAAAMEIIKNGLQNYCNSVGEDMSRISVAHIGRLNGDSGFSISCYGFDTFNYRLIIQHKNDKPTKEIDFTICDAMRREIDMKFNLAVLKNKKRREVRQRMREREVRIKNKIMAEIPLSILFFILAATAYSYELQWQPFTKQNTISTIVFCVTVFLSVAYASAAGRNIWRAIELSKKRKER